MEAKIQNTTPERNLVKNHNVLGVAMAGMYIVFFSMLTHVMNYLFNIFMGRMLSPVNFGEMSALWGIYGILGVPAGALSMLVARDIAGGMNFKRSIKKIKPKIKKIILITVLVSIFISFFVVNKLQIEIGPFFIIVLAICFGYYQSIYQAVLLGKESFIRYNLVGVVATLGKLSTGILFVYLGWNVLGASLSLVIAAIIGIVYSVYINKQTIEKEENIINQKLNINEVSILDQNITTNTLHTLNESSDGVSKEDQVVEGSWDEVIKVTLSSFVLVAFMNLDIVAAKYFFEPNFAGLYASMSTISKIPLFISLAISGILYAVYARLHNTDKKRGQFYFGLFSVFVVVTTFLASLLSFYFGEQIVNILFGAKYASIVTILPIGFIVYGVVTLLYSFVQYSIAKTEFNLTRFLISSIIYVIIFYEFFKFLQS